MHSTPGLWQLFWTFLRIGALAFGGFMSLVAVIREQVVRRRGWIADDDVMDGISLGGIMPGPLAVNVTAYLGFVMRGLPGALVCMAAVLLPSFLLVVALSWAYLRYGDLPATAGIFRGIMPAVAAIVLAVALDLFRKHVRQPWQMALVALAIPALIFLKGIWVTAAVMAAGALAGVWLAQADSTAPERPAPQRAFPWWAVGGLAILTAAFALAPELVTGGALHTRLLLYRNLFLTFGGMSVTLFGGGYVMIPAMQQVMVTELGWLNPRQFADGIAMGQVTPGPILITAAFVGYKLGGIDAALVATLGMFLPPALLMISAGTLLLRVKDRPGVQAAFAGLRPAVIGMVAAAAWLLSRDSILDPLFAVICIPAFVLAFWSRVSVLWIIPGAGLAGWILSHWI